MLTNDELLALLNGEVPVGVDPDSPNGVHYLRMIARVDALVAEAPPMTRAQVDRVATLLRGGGGNGITA